jgi:hypothetical protein
MLQWHSLPPHFNGLFRPGKKRIILENSLGVQPGMGQVPGVERSEPAGRT